MMQKALIIHDLSGEGHNSETAHFTIAFLVLFYFLKCNCREYSYISVFFFLIKFNRLNSNTFSTGGIQKLIIKNKIYYAGKFPFFY